MNIDKPTVNFDDLRPKQESMLAGMYWLTENGEYKFTEIVEFVKVEAFNDK